MDGVTVAVMHDEFQGVGLSGVSGFGYGTVLVEECGLCAGGYGGIFDARGAGKRF